MLKKELEEFNLRLKTEICELERDKEVQQKVINENLETIKGLESRLDYESANKGELRKAIEGRLAVISELERYRRTPFEEREREKIEQSDEEKFLRFLLEGLHEPVQINIGKRLPEALYPNKSYID